MINIQYSGKGTPYVWASELYVELEIAVSIEEWFPKMIDYGYIQDEDYSRLRRYSKDEDGSQYQYFDWAVQIDMAKHISMMQRSERGKALRNYLLSLDKEVEEGLLLNHEQISALFEICRVMGFFSVQKFFEVEHYKSVSQKKTWWEYRAKLFGYTASDLEGMMAALGKKYSSQRQSLMHIDKYELVRVAVLDMFIAMGKSEKYAQNVAAFAKKVAIEIKPDVYNDINTSIDFKTEHQNKFILDLKDYKNTNSVINNFLNSNKSSGEKSMNKV